MSVTVQQTQPVIITITAGINPLIVPNPIIMPGGIVGALYEQNLTQYVSGGVPPYTFSAAAGLPAGWSLTSAGVLTIQAYPAQGMQVQVGTVTDTGGQ